MTSFYLTKLFSLSNFDCLYLRQYWSYEQASKHRSASFQPEKGFWTSSGCHWYFLMTHKVLQVKCTVYSFCVISNPISTCLHPRSRMKSQLPCTWDDLVSFRSRRVCSRADLDLAKWPEWSVVGTSSTPWQLVRLLVQNWVVAFQEKV